MKEFPLDINISTRGKQHKFTDNKQKEQLVIKEQLELKYTVISIVIKQHISSDKFGGGCSNIG